VVGREQELTQLRDALERARAGDRQIVVVSGEPGIGKTSLVKTFVTAAGAQADVHVTWGQSAEHYGAAEPYLPLLEALTRACRGPSAERFTAALDRHAPTWLTQLPSCPRRWQSRGPPGRDARAHAPRAFRCVSKPR
jgi:hypothetical protein